MTARDRRRPAPTEQAGRPPERIEPEPIEPSPWDGLWLWALTAQPTLAAEPSANGP